MTFDWSDTLIVLGAVAIVAGAWLVYPPAALIVGGLVLAAVGLLLSHTSNPKG